MLESLLLSESFRTVVQPLVSVLVRTKEFDSFFKSAF